MTFLERNRVTFFQLVESQLTNIILNAMFNIFAKSVVSDFNSIIHQTRKRDKAVDDADDKGTQNAIKVGESGSLHA